MSTTSVWAAVSNETAGERARFPSLGQELIADVAIVGGGITGVTLALMLAEAGKSVVLLEAHAIGCGTTGNSTGNLHETVSAGLRLIHEKWGKELAALVAQARRVAIEHVEWRVQRFGINCGFRRCPLYMFDVEPTQGDELVREYEASRQAGLAAGIMENSPLPYAKGFCLVLENQAQFHPLDYVQALARHAAAAGCRIFEHSPVVAVDEEAKVLETPSGRVRAREIAFATHTPKGLYGVHAQMVPHQEYGLAFRSPGDLLPGIYWGQGGYTHSVRTVDTPAGAYMVVVGEDEKTGLHSPEESLERLRAYARSTLGVEQCEYAWSAQNYQSPDLLPFIGQTSGSDAYIATGFAADGLTYGTLAALIISDQVLGRGSEWGEPFRANRLPLVKAARGVLEETATVAKTFVGDRFDLARSGEFPSLAPGHARVVNVHGEKLAAYCRPDGSVSVVSAVCTHMKCIVHWNAAEQSWDCPCHGSRFDTEGKVLEGPALTGLEKRTVPERRAA